MFFSQCLIFSSFSDRCNFFLSASCTSKILAMFPVQLLVNQFCRNQWRFPRSCIVPWWPNTYPAYPADNYIFKVNNKNTRTRCEIRSKLTIKIPERRQRQRRIVNFERISHLVLVFIFLTLSRYMPAGCILNSLKYVTQINRHLCVHTAIIQLL